MVSKAVASKSVHFPTLEFTRRDAGSGECRCVGEDPDQAGSATHRT